jgi:hypothetical protein
VIRRRRLAAAVVSAPSQAAESIPAEFHGWLGRVTVAKTVPELKKFAENGGTILTIGSSTVLARHFGIPVRDALVETVNGVTRRFLAKSITSLVQFSKRASTTRSRWPTV